MQPKRSRGRAAQLSASPRFPPWWESFDQATLELGGCERAARICASCHVFSGTSLPTCTGVIEGASSALYVATGRAFFFHSFSTMLACLPSLAVCCAVATAASKAAFASSNSRSRPRTADRKIQRPVLCCRSRMSTSRAIFLTVGHHPFRLLKYDRNGGCRVTCLPVAITQTAKVSLDMSFHMSSIIGHCRKPNRRRYRS